jgi:formylglycine-generating enzyme required for sulfatase activity
MIEPLIENVNGYKFVMLPVEGGVYNMGSPETEIDAGEDEKPQHTVKISNFLMAQYPVVIDLWEVVVKKIDLSINSGNKLPIQQISWNDINKIFLPKLRVLTGMNYRLPTEGVYFKLSHSR